MIGGSCLCGEISFELTAAPEFMNHCHCRMCRKASGASFGTFLHAEGRHFRWVSGLSSIQTYESSPGNFRPFCSKCGSRVPVLEKNGAEVIIPAGALDDDPQSRPVVHFHVDSRAPWDEICDAVPQFAEYPDEQFWQSVFPNQ
jgi:hypothetical protein